jgi:hypothetical protein
MHAELASRTTYLIFIFTLVGNYVQSHISNKLVVLAAYLSTSQLMKTLSILGEKLPHAFERTCFSSGCN